MGSKKLFLYFLIWIYFTVGLKGLDLFHYVLQKVMVIWVVDSVLFLSLLLGLEGLKEEAASGGCVVVS